MTFTGQLLLPAALNLPARRAGQFPGVGRGPSDDIGDTPERHAEHVMQDEGDPGLRSERFQHDEQQHVQGFVERDPVDGIGAGRPPSGPRVRPGFRQPLADVVVAVPGAAHILDAGAGEDLRQRVPQRLTRRPFGRRHLTPQRERALHGPVGVLGGPEDPHGDVMESRALGGELVGRCLGCQATPDDTRPSLSGFIIHISCWMPSSPTVIVSAVVTVPLSVRVTAC